MGLGWGGGTNAKGINAVIVFSNKRKNASASNMLFAEVMVGNYEHSTGFWVHRHTHVELSFS